MLVIDKLCPCVCERERESEIKAKRSYKNSLIKLWKIQSGKNEGTSSML